MELCRLTRDQTVIFRPLLRGKKHKVYRTFATFLGAGDETIRKEVPQIQPCLDRNLSRWL
jgi:hypothetical protein